ncbi:hypothetical protein CNMCM5793_006515 [Aspergillus hiratsukae]|uniref:Uncharacterized protein n=1 Tax=Aspergillus hiratsukae TaxID=1194566 RepID=A0A8H6UIQ6_9EURO|nr:hypothetical protein CNMCM5793_006515 [Aspergillus hiratsukae]
MARPFQVPYEPEYETLSSPSTNTPVAPQARGETPISFRTNVNRAKTKRWVEAKKYSYDGNDWGEDEYEEYDDEPPPMPEPASFSQSANDLSRIAPRDLSRPPLPSMDRSRSMDQVGTLGVGPAGSRSRSTERNAVESSAGSAPSNKPLPFVRPADIYKRMLETRKQSPGTPRNDSPSSPGRSHTEPVSTSQPPATADQELHLAPGPNAPKDAGHGKVDTSSATPGTAPGVSSPELPDVKRLSGFDPGFLASDSGVQKEQSSDPQPKHQLQHNPSVGFVSVVHQAFDVPETPSSTVDSVARSNSDSTSVISPIICTRGPNEEKTPTIVEEPGEISTPKDTNTQAMVFKPGHRRDLSLPSPGNSPSRKPIINNSAEATPPPVLAEMSSETPSDTPGDSSSAFQEPLPHRASVLLPQTGSDRDLPAPLNFGANPLADSPIKSNEEIPVIVPSVSAETSPQDTESDRLRKEIIRSLSRETTPSAETEQQDPTRPQTTRQDTETSRQDSLIPSEYERYWSEQIESSPQDLRPPAPVYGDSQNASQQDLYSSSPMSTPAAAAPAQPTSEPKLKRRFSWESSSEEEEVHPVGLQATSPSAIPIPGQFPVPHDTTELAPETFPNESETTTDRGHGADLQQTPEKPKLTIMTPASMENNSDSNESYVPEVVNRQSMEERSPLPEPKMPPTVEPTLLGFRDIMGIQSSDERVRAFDRTRDQFATIDTGLKNWLQVVIRAHPEHMDVVEQSMKVSTVEPKAVVSKGKFPKLSSLGHFASSNQDGPPSASGHARRPSATLASKMNKQQVEQRGKELLHTAGALGGLAGSAAKGLFAKGRNKLKRGEAEKAHFTVPPLFIPKAFNSKPSHNDLAMRMSSEYELTKSPARPSQSARASASASARAVSRSSEISLNLIGVGQPGNLNPSDMLSPANQTPVPSPPGTATSPTPGLSRWHARKSRDEAEIFTHSRGVSRSSATRGLSYESGSVAGSNSPRASSNAQVSQDDLFDADLAARGSPQRKLASPKSKSSMEKFRLFRRNQGTSFDEPAPKADRSRRGAFDRLGGWFSRSQQLNKTQAHGRSPESSVAQTMEWLRPSAPIKRGESGIVRGTESTARGILCARILLPPQALAPGQGQPALTSGSTSISIPPT